MLVLRRVKGDSQLLGFTINWLTIDNSPHWGNVAISEHFCDFIHQSLVRHLPQVSIHFCLFQCLEQGVCKATTVSTLHLPTALVGSCASEKDVGSMPNQYFCDDDQRMEIDWKYILSIPLVFSVTTGILCVVGGTCLSTADPAAVGKVRIVAIGIELELTWYGE